MDKYDISILGAGPGGYVAALYAAQHGLNICLIEEDKVGGVCLNYGCIPTKTLVKTAEMLSDLKQSSNIGIKVDGFNLDFNQTIKRKNEVVEKQKKGIEALLKSRKVELKIGRGEFIDRNTIKIGADSIRSDYSIIATGSRSSDIPCAKVDGINILSSKEMLSLESVPKDLVIIGGGAIGCEFANIYRGFASRVIIVEMMERLVPGLDAEFSKRLESALKKKGIEIFTEARAESISYDNNRVTVTISNGKVINCDKVLVCAGRRPNVENIGLENAGVACDKGGIKVDDTLKTSADNIYAIGDCIGGYMYAHVASYEGIIAVNNIVGKKQKADYRVVPSCIFTNPDIASCGINEDTAKNNNLNFGVSKFYFRSLGKAHVVDKTEGLVKMVYDKKTKKILGMDIMGESASDLIGEAALAIRKEMTYEDVINTIHAHPTMPEAILETCHIANGKPIHSL